MPRQLLQTIRLADPALFNALIVATIGLTALIAEGTMLSLHGKAGTTLPLLAILLASTASSIAGFAFSALCGGLLFNLIESPVYVVQVMIVCSMAMQMFCIASLWRTIDWKSLPPFLIGGVLGVPAGAYLLLHLPSGLYRDVIGALLIIYAAYLLFRRPTRPINLGPLADVGAGFLGGFTGGLCGFPGSFVTIWCGLKGWDKARQRGVYQPFILCMQPVSLIAIHLMRSSDAAAELDWQMLAYVPAALLGAWLGLNIFKRLSDRQFGIAVNLLLVVSGVGLIL